MNRSPSIFETCAPIAILADPKDEFFGIFEGDD
jgi:hypothetical protein